MYQWVVIFSFLSMSFIYWIFKIEWPERYGTKFWVKGRDKDGPFVHHSCKHVNLSMHHNMRLMAWEIEQAVAQVYIGCKKYSLSPCLSFFYWFCSFKNRTLPEKKKGCWYFFATALHPSDSNYVIGFSSLLFYSYHSVNGFAPLAYLNECRCWAMA